MAYNVDFLLSALIFLLIILNHFMEQRALNTKSTKAFLTFLLLVSVFWQSRFLT